MTPTIIAIIIIIIYCGGGVWFKVKIPHEER